MPRRRICPRCGSKKLQEKLDKKEIVLGGCCVTENDPTHHCNTYKKDFGAPTLEKEMDEKARTCRYEIEVKR